MQLIQVNCSTIGTEVKQTVNARDLHLFLEVGKDFSSWVKVQIERARLVEDRDFIKLTQKGERQISVDYHLTLEAGKHVSMMSNTDKGFEVRDYFIECEKVAKQAALPLTPQMQLAHAMLLAGNMIEEQKLQIEQRDKLISLVAPKAAALDLIATADGSLCIQDAAKGLQLHPLNTLTKYLHANKWIYRRPGCAEWKAHQDFIRKGLLEHKVRTFPREDGTEKLTEQVRITPKGLSRLAVIFGMKEAA